jgi:hypothetical protein
MKIKNEIFIEMTFIMNTSPHYTCQLSVSLCLWKFFYTHVKLLHYKLVSVKQWLPESPTTIILILSYAANPAIIHFKRATSFIISRQVERSSTSSCRLRPLICGISKSQINKY